MFLDVGIPSHSLPALRAISLVEDCLRLAFAQRPPRSSLVGGPPHTLAILSMIAPRFPAEWRALLTSCLNPRISISQTVREQAVRSRSARRLGSDSSPRASRSSGARYGLAFQPSSTSDVELS